MFDLILYVTSTVFQLNRDRVFLGWTSTELGLMCFAQGPKRNDAGGARIRGPLVLSQALNHWATALPYKKSCTLLIANSVVNVKCSIGGLTLLRLHWVGADLMQRHQISVDSMSIRRWITFAFKLHLKNQNIQYILHTTDFVIINYFALQGFYHCKVSQDTDSYNVFDFLLSPFYRIISFIYVL